MPDRRSNFDIPDQGDEPVIWDAQRRQFVPIAPAVPPVEPVVGTKPRQWFVGADAVGKAPPPREGGGSGAGGAGGATSVNRAPAAAPAATPASARAAPPRPAPAKSRRRLLRRPKLRWILAFIGLAPLLLAAAGWWYASAKFNEIEKVPVSSVLSPTSEGGTNYLILGSDSRDAVVAAGGTDPNVQPNDESPSGQRSDTMMILRTSGDGAVLMSVPRDLFVTLPDGSHGRINGAYNDGPAAVIQTIQSNLEIPINRYIEVDFFTFSSLVDALGGVTLGADVIPCPAHDVHSGLFLPTAGPITMDGATALSFVRSRHYTEVCDGVERTDPTGDLGRVTRQQAFLRTVMAKAGHSRNPVTLLRVASSVGDGLRVDDGMSLLDAMKFAWNMGRLDPQSVVLPTFGFRTDAGAAVLGLDQDAAPAILDQFR